jgi:hypothetical protein
VTRREHRGRHDVAIGAVDGRGDGLRFVAPVRGGVRPRIVTPAVASTAGAAAVAERSTLPFLCSGPGVSAVPSAFASRWQVVQAPG